MNFWNNKKIRYGIIAILAALCAVLAFVIRILPVSDLAGTGDMIAGPDAWYNLRLVEVLMNSGAYINYEPMTLYPTGQTIVWGPLFTYISALFAILAGAASRIAIIDAVSWVPAVLGALMIPVMFFLGKKLGDWKTGLIAALFVAVIGGQFFSRSLYGHFDHHIAETLFSTLFCMCYCMALVHTRDKKIEWKEFSTLKIPLLFGIFAGISYLLGLLTMTTIIIFGLFAAVLTLIQFIIDYKSEHSTKYLIVLNTLTFGIAAIGLLIYGIKDGLSLYDYSLGLFLLQILVIIGTFVLYGLAKLNDRLKKPWYFYLIELATAIIVLCVVLAAALPDVFNMIIGNIIGQFSVSSGGGETIQEMQHWSMDGAVKSFGWSLLLAVGGAVVLLIDLIKRKSPAALFVLIWTLGIFILTIGHVRWEYYFAANIALLAAVFVSWAIPFAAADVKKLAALIKSKTGAKKEIEDEPAKKKGKNTKRAAAHKAAAAKPDSLKLVVLAVVLLLGCVFVGCATADAVYLSSVYGKGGGTAPYWIDACEWLEENTPETDVDYYTIYDKNTFTYPETAYGVVSWWDFGHYITTISKRIPVANPFQAGVSGEYGVAQILVETNEDVVAEKLDHLDSKYVMVDYNTGNNFIGIMGIWAGKDIKTASDYYGSLAFRLYNLGGSKSSSAYNIPALTHFRLVYDSPYYGEYENGNVVGKNTKTFEYVKGAVIKGIGTISAKITTNSGAEFTYEQESKNGQFVVPYATGKNGAVTASAYTIKETGQTITVSESAVLNGLVVN